jgi:hypothetical protein
MQDKRIFIRKIILLSSAFYTNIPIFETFAIDVHHG